MTWVKLDDQWADHPKFADVSDLAQLLWVKGLTYACRYKTRGHVPAGRLAAMVRAKGTPKMAAELVTAGLWVEAPGGYLIHDFQRYQQVADRVSDARREAGRAGAAKRWAGDGNSHGFAISKPDGNGLANDSNADGKVSRAPARTPADARRASSSDLSLPPLETDPDPDPTSQRARIAPSVPSPASEIEVVAQAIDAWPVFRDLDARAIAETNEGRRMQTGQRVAWLVAAVEECAAKVAGLGLDRSALQARLVGFLRAAKAPKASAEAPASGARPRLYDPDVDDPPLSDEEAQKRLAELQARAAQPIPKPKIEPWM